jgi:hypothetical protein
MEENTAMEVLAEQPFQVLEELYLRVVCASDQVRHEDGHILSTRAYCAGARTKYPVLKKLIAGKPRRFYCHHIGMLYKLRKENPNAPLWPSNMQVSHDCHNTRCVQLDHLSLCTQAYNNSKTISCIGKVECKTCGFWMSPCTHTPVCKRVVTATACSACEK